MSAFQDLRPYFQSRLVVADADFKEWTDGFNEGNIPNSIIDKSYHIEYGAFTLLSGLQNGNFSYDGPVTINCYFNGGISPIDAIDTAWSKAETIIQECCKHSQRLTQSSIKNILAQNVSVSALSQTNDNIIRLTIVFVCRVIVGVS